jgi:hypothetical protein
MIVLNEARGYAGRREVSFVERFNKKTAVVREYSWCNQTHFM